MPQDDNTENMAIDRAMLLYQKIQQKIKEHTKGIPIGMKPMTSKEQMERYLRMTPQDKLMFYQKYGHDTFVRMVADNEKLIERSEAGVRRYYKIGEE